MEATVQRARNYHERERRVNPAQTASRQPVQTPEATKAVRSSVRETILSRSSVGRSFHPITAASHLSVLPFSPTTTRLRNNECRSQETNPPPSIISTIYLQNQGEVEEEEEEVRWRIGEEILQGEEEDDEEHQTEIEEIVAGRGT